MVRDRAARASFRFDSLTESNCGGTLDYHKKLRTTLF